jgi:hypothetical protein
MNFAAGTRRVAGSGFYFAAVDCAILGFAQQEFHGPSLGIEAASA